MNLAGFRRGASPRMPGACVTLMGLRLPEDLKPTVNNQQQAQVFHAHSHAPHLSPACCPDLHHSLRLLQTRHPCLSLDGSTWFNPCHEISNLFAKCWSGTHSGGFAGFGYSARVLCHAVLPCGSLSRWTAAVHAGLLQFYFSPVVPSLLLGHSASKSCTGSQAACAVHASMLTHTLSRVSKHTHRITAVYPLLCH